MSLASVVLDDALDAPARLGMVSGIDEGDSTPVACELDAREQTEGVRVIQRLPCGHSELDVRAHTHTRARTRRDEQNDVRSTTTIRRERLRHNR